MAGKFDPGSEHLGLIQSQAEAAGRRCVVGGLVANLQGYVFVQKRSRDRPRFPGCWDIVGGHVELGETMSEALARIVKSSK